MRNAWRRLLGLVSLSLVLGMGSAGCDTSPSCEDAGREFDEGAVWTCADGCNFCQCDQGKILHTAADCLEPAGPAAGKLICIGHPPRRHGDVWVCADGCSECTCSDGDVLTTTKECAPSGAAGAGGAG